MANTNRIDRLISDLQRIQGDANAIFDAHVDVMLRAAPYGTSFGATKYELLAPAGSTLNYVKALGVIRDTLESSSRKR